jgi:hypothetical protein
MSLLDFNTAADANEFGVIPAGTIASVRMKIIPGGVTDLSLGLPNGLGTKSKSSDSIFLSCEFVVLQGQYSKRKIWSLIGIKGQKGKEWGDMGRSFIKGILNSVHNLSSKDMSETAQNARKLNSLSQLDGAVFVARISVEKDAKGNDRNVIKSAVTIDSSDYNEIMDAPPVLGNGYPTAVGVTAGFNDDIPF